MFQRSNISDVRRHYLFELNYPHPAIIVPGAAANAASVTPAAVSRSISRLDERLGVRLFVRTTRQIRLTDAGRVYFEQSRQALSQLVDAERSVTGEQAAPAGLLRITACCPCCRSSAPCIPTCRSMCM